MSLSVVSPYFDVGGIEDEIVQIRGTDYACLQLYQMCV